MQGKKGAGHAEITIHMFAGFAGTSNYGTGNSDPIFPPLLDMPLYPMVLLD